MSLRSIGKILFFVALITEGSFLFLNRDNIASALNSQKEYLRDSTVGESVIAGYQKYEVASYIDSFNGLNQKTVDGIRGTARSVAA